MQMAAISIAWGLVLWLGLDFIAVEMVTFIFLFIYFINKSKRNAKNDTMNFLPNAAVLLYTLASDKPPFYLIFFDKVYFVLYFMKNTK